MAMQESDSVVGVFENLESANKSLEDLRHAGFSQEDIGIVGHVGESSQTMAAPSAVKPPEENVTHSLLFGGILGAVVGALVILIIPGTGLVSGAGIGFEVLGGLALGGAAGGIFAAFSGLLLARTRSRRIARELHKGHIVVAVKTTTRSQEALSVLRRHGGTSAK